MAGESAVATAETSSERAELLAGKYLTFELGEEIYGIGILKIQEIIGLMNVTKVPRTPDWVRGVINLRGKVIPVTDLRLKFGMPSEESTERTCIIVVQITQKKHEVTMGILVDEVSEVLDIHADQIEDSPSFGSGVDTRFILGMGKVGEQVVILLEVDKVLSHEELDAANEIANHA